MHSSSWCNSVRRIHRARALWISQNYYMSPPYNVICQILLNSQIRGSIISSTECILSGINIQADLNHGFSCFFCAAVHNCEKRQCPRERRTPVTRQHWTTATVVTAYAGPIDVNQSDTTGSCSTHLQGYKIRGQHACGQQCHCPLGKTWAFLSQRANFWIHFQESASQCPVSKFHD